ncbi:MAG TPA: N-acetylmuramoyl-L-alanine amidase [Kribbella sp.]|nr:N-acetylmuramoyl-L-alanine amidase [Kribbella sp.]
MRRHPKILAVLAAVALPLSVIGVSSADPPSAVATAATASPGAAAEAFRAASQQYGVPESVLLAVSYAETRWDDHQGQPSTSGGYGPMHLTSVDPAETADLADGPRAVTADSLRTLDRAAELTGLDPAALRTDATANIAGGAALLADHQRSLGLAVGAETSPADWFAAVGEYAGADDQAGAAAFADDVYAILARGAARTTNTGQQLAMAPLKVTPQRAQLARTDLPVGAASTGPVECPDELACEWLPAPYAKTGTAPTAYGNHDTANRPETGKIDYIVIHDTEVGWQGTLNLVQNPSYLAWQYTMRSSDGKTWQHLAAKDVGWQAGNWYVNMHSIGIEHEGFAAQGATWFTEALYRNSARLVRYLAEKNDIPLDRAHIIGHDQVPGTVPSTVAGMHWDPGPYWDWEHYFDLLGAPIHQSSMPVHVGSVVTVKPGFDDNIQLVTRCNADGTCAPQGTNFVYLRQAPDDAAPLVKDIGLRPSGAASTTQVSDIGARAAAGSRYVIADQSGDWLAIWYLGAKGWFRSPEAAPDAFAKPGFVVTPKAGLASVPVYGRAYPERDAYPAGIPYQTVTPLQYSIGAGQSYPVGDRDIETDYYRAVTFDGVPPTDHVQVLGQDRYYQIWFGHRMAYVRAADVDVSLAH